MKVLSFLYQENKNSMYPLVRIFSENFQKNPRMFLRLYLDNIYDEELRSLLPIDVIEGFTRSDLHYKTENEKGVVFHLLGSLSKFGKVGVTCIGDSLEEAEEIYQKTVKMLKDMACEF